MNKPIEDFAKLFGAKLSLDKNLIVKKRNSIFLLSHNLKAVAEETYDWLFAGMYLGKVDGGKFFPSFLLLSIIADCAKNKLIVDDKTAWLFICGRDVFKEGILKAYGSRNKGAYTLVLNSYGECLGFGKIERNLDKAKSGVVVKNILDVGDFLRREQKREF